MLSPRLHSYNTTADDGGTIALAKPSNPPTPPRQIKWFGCHTTSIRSVVHARIIRTSTQDTAPQQQQIGVEGAKGVADLDLNAKGSMKSRLNRATVCRYEANPAFVNKIWARLQTSINIIPVLVAGAIAVVTPRR
jgi:hypothetical protein